MLEPWALAGEVTKEAAENAVAKLAADHGLSAQDTKDLKLVAGITTAAILGGIKLSGVSKFANAAKLQDHYVQLGAGDRRDAGCQIERLGKYPGVPSCVGCAVVREMLDSMRSPRCPKPLLDHLQHDVAHIRAGDPSIGDRCPSDDLPVEGVDNEGETNDLIIPASELQTVGAPAQV